MLKKYVVVAASLVCLAGSSFAANITWAYEADLGLSGAASAGWLVELIEDVTQDGISIGGVQGSGAVLYDDRSMDGDAFIGTPVTTTLAYAAKGGLTWLDSFSAPASTLGLGDSIYTVVYNASTFEAATQYMVIDMTPYSLPSSDIPDTYALSTSNDTWAPIVPVPEPGSVVLFALGLVTLAARRKRR